GSARQARRRSCALALLAARRRRGGSRRRGRGIALDRADHLGRRPLLERQIVGLEVDPHFALQLGREVELGLAAFVDRGLDRRHVAALVDVHRTATEAEETAAEDAGILVALALPVIGGGLVVAL